MATRISNLFNDSSDNLRAKVIGVYVLLFAANIAAWSWALVAFRDYPLLLGTAFLAYTFGCGTPSTPITSRRSTM